MVRRITLDEASANFKDIVERTLENGDSLELERDGRVIGTINPERPAVGKVGSLHNLFKSLAELSPVDDAFADDLQAAVDAQQIKVPENRWDD